MTSSPLSHESNARWTIYVCPKCGRARSDTKLAHEACGDRHAPTLCEPVEVVPVQPAGGPRQDSLTDQLATLRELARSSGCYDAMDWLDRQCETAKAAIPAVLDANAAVASAGGPDTVERVVELFARHAVFESFRDPTVARQQRTELAREVVAAVGPVGRSCEVTDETVERLVAWNVGAPLWDMLGADEKARAIATSRPAIEAALGATADKEAHGG